MLKAGFARLDITPPFGTPIAGYFHERITKGVLDPLELNALAVSDGENTAVIIACDIIGIRMTVSDRIRGRIAKKTGLPVKNIFLTALHQHTTFRLMDTPAVGNATDPVYLETLYRKFEDIACLAIDDLSDATAETAEGETDVQLSFVRRYLMKEGPVATNPKRLDPNIIGPASDPDNTVRLVRFRRTDKKDIALVNFSTHPDVIGGEKVSADWPGFTRRFVEKDNDNISCIVINGAQGDVNHINFQAAKQWDDRYAHSRFMGRTIADTVKKLWDKTTPQKDGRVQGLTTVIYSKTNTEGEEKYAECRAFLDAEKAGTLGYKPHITELAFASRIVRLRLETIYRPVPISVIGFGNIALVGFGGEPFTVYATNARNAAPDKFVIAACCANGAESYLPSAKSFSEGGYESSGSFYTPAIEQECSDAAKALLDSL